VKGLWVTIAAVAAFGAMAFVWSHSSDFTPLDVGSPVPAYGAVSLEGDTVRLADLHGRVVLLNVWATWCSPCVREMPALQRLHERLRDKGLSVVAVSIDVGAGATGAVRAFVEHHDLTFTILHDASGTVEDIFGVAGLPVTIVIDRNGRIHRKVAGERKWDAPPMASEIEALLRH
jgi:peroxiredoxin